MYAAFSIEINGEPDLHFYLYYREAPLTCTAFMDALPFERNFYHAKLSGEEIWTPHGLGLAIPQENATVFIEEGEIALGPLHSRNKIADCIGIMYGTGKLLDCGNIFGRVQQNHLKALKVLGRRFWLQGENHLRFKKIK